MGFLRHEPCEKCGSKDNKAVYSDGHTWCFGCSTYTPGHEHNVEEPLFVCKDPSSELETKLPEENRVWLSQYLTDDQINLYFWWHPTLKRHVYLEYDRDHKVCFWEARKVGEGDPKTLSFGAKPYRIWGKWKETGVVAIVEDIVSAIKLSDFVGVVCLHGAIIPNGLYTRLGYMSTISTVLVWLDRDKLSNAYNYVRKFSTYGLKCSLIMTPKDPKCYSLDEVKGILKDAI